MKPWERYKEGPWTKFQPKQEEDPRAQVAKEWIDKNRQAPSGWLQGWADPALGAAQLFANIFGLDSLDQAVRDNEERYQAAREVTGETGMDWDRLGGNISSPANLALVAGAPAAPASFGGRIAQGMALGAAGGAMQPVTQGDYWTEKAKQTAIGGGAGALPVAATSAVARVIKPKSSPEVQALMREGITPTPGSTLGGFARRVEDASTSIPLLGEAVRYGKLRSINDFNRAVLSRALDPIGMKLPKTVKPGREGVAYVERQLRKAYSDVLNGTVGVIDDTMRADLNSLQQLMANSNLSGKAQRQLQAIIKNEILDRFTPQGRASGETIKVIESELGKIAKKLESNSDYDIQKLSTAVTEAQAILRGMVERVNPDKAEALKAANRGWANFKVLQRAASAAGSKEGVVTPATLRAASRAGDSSLDKGRFARGDAMLQDLAEAGEAVLPSTVPDSGTPLRLFTDAALMGGAASINPGVAAGLLGMMAPYSGVGSRAFANAAARRPEVAGLLADLTRQTGPILAPGVAPAAYSMFAPLDQ